MENLDFQSKLLLGKVALVTGASRGIGRSIAQLFAQNGSDIAIGYMNSETEALETKAKIEELGRTAVVYKANTADTGEVNKMVSKVYNHFGKIDILVNCAGVFRPKYLIKTTENDLDYVLDVNLKGVFTCMKASIKYMIAAHSGCIVNISSIIGRFPEVNSAAYAVSKAGVIALSQAAAKEYRDLGVRINVIAPGMVETNMTANAYSKESKEEYINQIPLRRIAKPEDIANAALLLSVSPFLNGEIIEIDGGMAS